MDDKGTKETAAKPQAQATDLNEAALDQASGGGAYENAGIIAVQPASPILRPGAKPVIGPGL